MRKKNRQKKFFCAPRLFFIASALAGVAAASVTGFSLAWDSDGEFSPMAPNLAQASVSAHRSNAGETCIHIPCEERLPVPPKTIKSEGVTLRLGMAETAVPILMSLVTPIEKPAANPILRAGAPVEADDLLLNTAIDSLPLPGPERLVPVSTSSPNSTRTQNDEPSGLQLEKNPDTEFLRNAEPNGTPSISSSQTRASLTNTSASNIGRPTDPQTMTLKAADGLKLAEALVEKGEVEAAEAILIKLRDANAPNVNQTQVSFLLGLIAFQREEYDEAVALYRDILDDQPALVRVRLELARTLFALKRDRVAAYHFRLALAEDLPENAKTNIRVFLALIEARKQWRVNASAGIAPDTNVSAGPRDRQVQIFGLPFELDDDARQRSGVGLTTALSAEYFPRIHKNWRLEARAGGTFTDYSNIRFDDLFLFGEVGPRYESKNYSVSVLGAYSRRFFGGEGFSESVGVKSLVGLGVTSRTRLFLRSTASYVRYDLNEFRNGPVLTLGATAVRALSRGATLRGGLSVSREQTDSNVLRNTQFIVNGAYGRELPYAVTVQAGPEIYWRQFDTSDPVNNDLTRRDITYGGSLFVTKRDWRLYGFAPVATYQFLRNESNVDRFDFTRHRLNVSLTRVF